MSQKPTISLHNTEELLQEHFLSKVTNITLLSGGEWSQAYSFVSQNKKYVLRWCNASETFEKDTFAFNFQSENLPVPQIIHTGNKFDTYYAVSEFVQGDFIEKLTVEQLDNALPSLLCLFDSFRTVDLSTTSGYGGWDKNGIGEHKSWQEYLLSIKTDDTESVTSGWQFNLEHSELGFAIFNKLYGQLKDLVKFCPEERELIHSDLLNFNLLVKDSNISGVIDWQCSLYGDSLYDIAWFIYYAPWYPQFKTIKLRERLINHFKSAAKNNTHIDERLSCYFIHIGLGSIAYNAFKQDWKAAEAAADYTLGILKLGTKQSEV